MAGANRLEGDKKKKKVVVVGGGIGGSAIALALQFVADVVLIDPKEYLEIPWANLRAMVEPSFAERSVINHSDYLTNVRIVISSAVNVTELEVFTSEGDSVDYDYLVIATGHPDSIPRTRTERLSQYQAGECNNIIAALVETDRIEVNSKYEKIQSAQSILIVGGGPTGVELAGEIAIDFPDKSVKLVHRGSRLLEFIGFKASQKTLDWLVSKKVEVFLDESVNLQSASDGIYETSSGETITADCHFLCIGKPVGSAWLRETFLQTNLDSQGRLIVDKTMRVNGQRNVFAVGDITNVKEIKQGYLAQRHAQVISKNLKLLISGGDESKMAYYTPGSEMALVSLGRNDGVAQFPYMTIGGFIPGLIKSRDLFVGRTRKHLGLPPDIADESKTV